MLELMLSLPLPPYCSPHPCMSPCWHSCLYLRTSSGPLLSTGDDTVSGSLLSQPKCHLGDGWPFPVEQEQAASVRRCHPCGYNDKCMMALFLWQTTFTHPALLGRFHLLFSALTTIINADEFNKKSHCKKRLMYDISVVQQTTWRIRSHWKDLF